MTKLKPHHYDANDIAKLVKAVRAFMPSKINMDCDMSNDAIVPLDVKLIELRAIKSALAKLDQKS